MRFEAGRIPSAGSRPTGHASYAAANRGELLRHIRSNAPSFGGSAITSCRARVKSQVESLSERSDADLAR
jgi:hypothetical protein